MDAVVQKTELPMPVTMWSEAHVAIMCSKQPLCGLGHTQVLYWEYASSYHNLKLENKDLFTKLFNKIVERNIYIYINILPMLVSPLLTRLRRR